MPQRRPGPPRMHPRRAEPFLDLDPADLDRVRTALRAADPDGHLAPIGLRHLVIGGDALPRLSDVVAAVARSPRVVLVQDATPMRRGTGDLKPDVARLLAARFALEVAVIGRGRAEIHGDEQDLAQATAAVEGAGCAVALGSGTITDLCKEATRLAGGVPLVVVQTAASVNAFADDLAVLVRAGTKRTTPSRWADALLIDLQVLADAPPAMTLAGFGDLMAVWTAPADWSLASRLGMDDAYHPAPVAMLVEPARAMLAAAPGLAARRPEALDRLARLLTLSGMAMGVARTTAPLSGTEHLISHLIDMAAIGAGRPTALHGAQVGVCAVVAAAAWQVFLDEFDPAQADLERAFPDEATMEPVVRGAFASTDADGRAGDECWNDVRRKLRRWQAARPCLKAFLSAWPRHRAALAAMTLPPERLADALRSAGAPVRFSDLAPPVPAEVARWALGCGHLMRNRFTLLDLLAVLGRWDERGVARVLDRARAAGGGL
ncbi:MAG: iron-containing alcohol dehydrogenase [Armatimonadota bacterium]|nr:iron-containing alcohol dehydrogenase [Armatimonadota bacterium]